MDLSDEGLRTVFTKQPNVIKLDVTVNAVHHFGGSSLALVQFMVADYSAYKQRLGLNRGRWPTFPLTAFSSADMAGYGPGPTMGRSGFGPTLQVQHSAYHTAGSLAPPSELKRSGSTASASMAFSATKLDSTCRTFRLSLCLCLCLCLPLTLGLLNAQV
jgi:hypothetical protein